MTPPTADCGPTDDHHQSDAMELLGCNSESLLRESVAGESATIMIVDDEPINIKVVQRHLRVAGYANFVTTSEPREALQMIRRDEPDVIVLDVMMPHVGGLEILEVIRGDIQLHHIPVLILTAATDEETEVRALELGATDFLSKPVRSSELVPRVRNALVVKSHHDHMANYSTRLEHEVQRRTEELNQSRMEVIHVLACAAEYRDHETGNHVLRVGRYAGVIARKLSFASRQVELIEQAAILHDVGKIGIADAILLKPGRLEKDEFEAMQNHCDYGANILRGLPSERASKPSLSSEFDSLTHSPILKLAATISMSHHEKWDGSGYPHGISGEAIPIEGRITAVADVFDALSTRRPYKEPFALDRCFEILQEGRGQHFDPKVLDAFFACKPEVVQIALELADG
jgi:putative two-component system response regulator